MTGLLAATGGRELWYLTRATGLVTLVLLSAVVALGIATTGDWERHHWPRFLTQGLHRNLSLLSLWFLFLHVGTTVVDGYVPIGWANAVVPFTSPYHRLWLGLGAVSCDLLLAVLLTSVVRRHLRPGTWRGVHWLAYASWPVALMHGIGTGTDATTTVLRVTAASCMLLVAATVLWRFGHRFPAGIQVRAAGGVALVLVMAGAAFGLDGGLRSHTLVEVHSAAPVRAAGAPGSSGGPRAPGGPPGAGAADPSPPAPPGAAAGTPIAVLTPLPGGSEGPGAAVVVPVFDDVPNTGSNTQPAGAEDGPAASPTTTTTTTSSPPPPGTTTTTSTSTTTTTTVPSTTTTTTPRHCIVGCKVDNGKGRG